ncbi:homeobox protein NANOG isoform X2 [Oryctolagus cuniculus]|uniref:homeobox protein NANOG isoform X2 n=1 Tax=Oryctolagus cuniculus TaxID=9986 RepID=UPI0007EE905E|nr:homeobox protein NANOG isoform X2 [Oryctolagus cuniculus]
MSVDPACPASLPASEALDDQDSSLMPVVPEPEGKHPTLQLPCAQVPLTDTASPLPSSMDLPTQESPDSSTSPSPRVVKTPDSAEKSTKKEEKVKKQKIRTVFSQTQLCVLNDRFQRQKYLSLQQMQELSSLLNLSYKQVKTWFQNQRMKCKRWQRNNWPNICNSVTQGCLVNTPGSLPMWNNQTWNNQTWNNPAWNSQSWSNHSWDSQAWYSQAWNNQAWNSPFLNCGDEVLQSSMQLQQNCPVSDLESILETVGESQNTAQQTTKHFSASQALDLLLNYSVNMQPENV